MKNRILLLVCSALLIAGNVAYAQNMYDALRFSEQNGQGTARSVAMGNAFVALGGDIGGIFINPAASGVYKYHEASITASLNSNSTTNAYLGNSITKNSTTIDLGNVGIVGTFKTGRQNKGLISWNLGIALNKYQTFYKTDVAGGRTGSSSYLQVLQVEQTEEMQLHLTCMTVMIHLLLQTQAGALFWHGMQAFWIPFQGPTTVILLQQRTEVAAIFIWQESLIRNMLEMLKGA